MKATDAPDSRNEPGIFVSVMLCPICEGAVKHRQTVHGPSIGFCPNAACRWQGPLALCEPMTMRRVEKTQSARRP